jgi:hypothetical protein
MESFYRSYYLMPQAGYAPEQATAFQSAPAPRKRASKSPGIISTVSSFLQIIGLKPPSAHTSQSSLHPSPGPKKRSPLTEIPESAIADTTTSSLSDESSSGSPASLFSDYSNASSATSLATEFPDSPASLSWSITTHDLRTTIKSTPAVASNDPHSRDDLPVNELAVSLRRGLTTCPAIGEDDSFSCTENDPFNETEADSDGRFGHNIPRARNPGEAPRGEPWANCTDDGLFMEGYITLDDWRQARFSWVAMAPLVAENYPKTNLSTLPEISPLPALNDMARFVPDEDVPSGVVTGELCIDSENDMGFEDWRRTRPSLFMDTQTPSRVASRVADTSYRPAAGVLDPSDGQVWMFYDSDSDVDDEDERDVHKAFMEHIEESRRRKQISNGETSSVATTGLDSPTGVKSARPTKQCTSWRGRYARSFVPRSHARSM